MGHKNSSTGTYVGTSQTHSYVSTVSINAFHFSFFFMTDEESVLSANNFCLMIWVTKMAISHCMRANALKTGNTLSSWVENSSQITITKSQTKYFIIPYYGIKSKIYPKITDRELNKQKNQQTDKIDAVCKTIIVDRFHGFIFIF